MGPVSKVRFKGNMSLRTFLFTLALGLGYASYVASSPDKECASVPSMSCEDVDVPVTEEKVERKCETVYNDVCHIVTETEHREECKTVNDRNCHTQYDEVASKDCKLKHEEQCYKTPKMECNVVQRTKYTTVIENVCKTENEEKCSTVVDNICETVNERKCSAVTEKRCDQVMKTM